MEITNEAYIQSVEDKIGYLLNSPLLGKVFAKMIAEEVLAASMDSDLREAWVNYATFD